MGIDYQELLYLYKKIQNGEASKEEQIRFDMMMEISCVIKENLLLRLENDSKNS